MMTSTYASSKGLIIEILVVLAVVIAASGSEQHPTAEKVAEFEKEKKIEFNEMVKNYLTTFEGLRKTPEFKEDADTMETMKMLMTQSWMYMLTPGIDQLKGLVPVGKKEGLETVKERIIDQLKEKNTKSLVSDAILHYVMKVNPKVQQVFTKKMDILKTNIRDLNERETKETDEEVRKKLLSEADEKGDEFEDADFSFKFENIATKMAVQSYVFDFVTTFVITSSDGKEHMEFDMPPLYQDSFEKLLEDDEFYERDGEDEEDEGKKKVEP